MRFISSNFHRLLKCVGRQMSTAAEDDVLFEIKDNIGIITLNRPKALNALNESMVKKVYTQLKEWEDGVSFVIVQGAGDRSFCAGGDVVTIAKATPANSHVGKSFFKAEYKMNYLTSMYKKPYISLVNGVTMGGGVGISVHGPYRIATEKTLFAMPETAIGLFPDVGGSYVLPRLQGKLGLFLGLTGYRLQGMDVVKAGIATHLVPSKDLPQFVDKLQKTSVSQIDTFLKDNTVDTSKSDFSLSPYIDQINECFNGNTVEEIFENLKKTDSPWFLDKLETLQKMSPTSMKVTKKLLDLGASQNLRQCLITEYRLAVAVVEARVSTDFYEGVRAQLTDKDKSPKWNPPSLELVTDDMVESCFKPLPLSEELDI